MISGHTRDYLPRLVLDLPGRDGPLTVEFVLDSAFEGDLALPSSLLSQLDATFTTERRMAFADSSIRRRSVYEILLDWSDEARVTEVVLLEGRPLLGVILLQDYSAYIEFRDGGEVQVEPL